MAMRYGTRPSNGTMGQHLIHQLCVRCTVECRTGWHPDGDESGPPCPILTGAYAGEDQTALGYDIDTGQWDCTAYVGPCPCATP